MAEVFSWCSFIESDGQNSRHTYRIRFNRISSRLFCGCKYVYVRKSKNHIIFTPVHDELDAEGRKGFLPVHYDTVGGAIISANNAVNQQGFIPSRLFGTGKRYKVKKDKDGRIYICINEVV